MSQGGRHRRRSRRVAAAQSAATAAVLLVAGCGSSEEPDRPEPKVAVGDCLAQEDGRPVSCSEPHRTQTIFVSDAPPARGTAALKPCRAAQAGFLGQDFNSRLDVRLWVAADESWYRCDLVLRNSTQAGSGYAVVSSSLEGAFKRDVPIDLQGCLDAPYDPLLDQEYVPCDEPHRSRELTVAPAIGTLDEPFPDDVADRAISACNATAAGADLLQRDHKVDAYYPEDLEAWESGERTADCWISAQRGRLPAVKPGD